MQILQIGLEWFPEQGGGLDRLFYDSIQHLPKVGVNIRGLVTGSNHVSQTSQGQVQSFAKPDASLWQRWRGVRNVTHNLLCRENYDLVASHFALYTFPILCELGDRPLVVHFHGPWAMESQFKQELFITSHFKKILEQITYRKATQLIVLSEAFRQILYQNYHIPIAKIQIIPGGIETKRFTIPNSSQDARSTLRLPQNRFIFLAVRRLTQRMGLENLITAIATVKQRYPEILLIVAGRGPLAKSLQEQINTLNLNQHIQLLGYVPDAQLPLLYRAANLAIVPTVALEGFGMIILESLASGTPVLGTPVGGIPEILAPFWPDLLLEGSSVTNLVQGILETMSGQRSLPGPEVCQTYIQNHYDWSAIAPQIKAVYETALKY